MPDIINDRAPDLHKKDFMSDQSVRWCPGCGDFMILNSLQKAFAELGEKKEDIVCVSGIGCSSRITYYLDTFGVHSIHGRAIPTATGIKLANPELSTWVMTGDGDCMAIGGNHFIHALRRNIDLNIVIFNNKIYGMTKGQSSPTSPLGLKTKTASGGVYERPFSIGELAISAGATFFARVPDKSPKLLEEVMHAAYKHKGTSVIEVLQNCVIYTDGIHEQITGKDTRDDNQIVLEHGEILRFGKDTAYGLVQEGFQLKKKPLDESEENFLRHDAQNPDPAFQLALARLSLPENPVAVGIIRNVDDLSFDQQVHQGIALAKENTAFKSLNDLYTSGNTWEIS